MAGSFVRADKTSQDVPRWVRVDQSLLTAAILNLAINARNAVPNGGTHETRRLGISLHPGWQRMQGFIFRTGDVLFSGKTAQEALRAALADSSCLMINRNAGSGTRILIDQLLEGRRPPGYANQPKSHNAVAAAIAQGRADWGIAIANVAKLYGLTFLPIAPEHYDFLVLDRHRTRPAVQAFLAALAEPNARQRIMALGMNLPEDTAQ
jgi:putative molybdopterin biosynthesis protein